MRIAYLECFSGISGDMFMGALLDAGVPQAVFEKAVASLKVGASLEISRVNRSGISATKIDVIVNGEKDRPREKQDPATSRFHTHYHSGPSQHARSHALSEIREIIGKASLPERAHTTAITIFEKLGYAEAKIHNIPVEQIHFHEVGAVDALVDITCAAVGAEALGVGEFICSPLNLGGGTVTCAHGTFPVPAPATVELLKGAPVYSSGIQAELVTPTGAAIVATLVERFGTFPEMTVDKTGYGAGARDFDAHANVLRICVGESRATERVHDEDVARETIVVLEANLDDVSPQIVGYVMNRLLEAGALDVFSTPVQMKKNRPGILLTVLARKQNADELAKIVFTETTTLGVRRHEETRQVLERQWSTVTTRFGDVRIKVASFNGTVSHYAPEYEDCRRIATEQRVPLKMIMQEALLQYLKTKKE